MAAAVGNEGGAENSVREAFEKSQKILANMELNDIFQADWMETPLGPILMAGDAGRLHFLSFIEQGNLIRKAALLQKNLKARIEMGTNGELKAARRELDEYFAGNRQEFDIPLDLAGSAFQTRVWEALRQVPYGHTVSYVELAREIGKPAAFRAVAQASAQSPVDIIVPRHRVINADGGQGGDNAGSERKRRLLEFERGVLAGSVPTGG